MGTRADVYELYRGGKVQAALLLAESTYDQSKDIDALVDLIQLLILQNFCDRAEEVLQNSKRSPQDSLEIYHLFHDLYEKAGRAEDLRNLELKLLGSKEGGQSSFTKSSRIPESLSIDSNYLAKQMSSLCNMYSDRAPILESVAPVCSNLLEQGKTNEAVSFLREASDNIQEDALRYIVRAEINLLKSEYRRAEQRYTKLLGHSDFSALAHNRLGDICLATGRNSNALVHYKHACVIDPADIESYMDLIRAQIVEGRISDAKRVYLRAVDRFGAHAFKPFREAIVKRPIQLTQGPSVMGLAWFEGGGGLLEIEVTSKAGKGLIYPMGNIGFSMQDSVRIAFEVARNLADENYPLARSRDIFVNVPRSVIYKDGPSAGLAFAVGILTELCGQTIREKWAFTGEVSLAGSIDPVGGIIEKLGAAYFAGMNNVCIPESNLADLKHVSPKIKQSININLVRSVQQVVEMAWMD